MHSCKYSFASKIESLDRSWPILKKLLIFWNYNYVAESISGKLISNTILTPECRIYCYPCPPWRRIGQGSLDGDPERCRFEQRGVYRAFESGLAAALCPHQRPRQQPRTCAPQTIYSLADCFSWIIEQIALIFSFCPCGSRRARSNARECLGALSAGQARTLGRLQTSRDRQVCPWG